MQFCFGDIVVVEGYLIGVVVKCWGRCNRREGSYEVYVRIFNGIKEYNESDVQRYMVRHKYLNDEELEYQANSIEW